MSPRLILAEVLVEAARLARFAGAERYELG